jgi:ABC-type polysaccharide/polyol phosphate export permease
MTQIRAALRRDWALAALRPAGFAFDAFAVIAGVGLLYWIGRFVGSTRSGTDYFAFAAAGLPILRMNGGVGRVVSAVSSGLANGTFELSVSGPGPTWVAITAELAFELLRGLVVGAVLLATAGAFGAPFTLTGAGLAGAAAGLIGATAAFAALGGVMVGLVLWVREAASLLALVTLALPIAAGAYFPVAQLPEPLETFASALPFHFAVDLVREGVIDGRFASGSAGWLALGVLVCVPAGLAAAGAGVRRGRRTGTLSTP